MKKQLGILPVLLLASLPASGVVSTFTAVSDSLIIAGGGADPVGNFGGRAELIGGDTAGQGRHMIMRWNVSTLLGTVSTVNSITVELDLLAAGRAAPTKAQTATVQLISEADKGWVEGSGVNNVTKVGVTWNHANATAENVGTPWSGGPGLAGGSTVADVGTFSIAGTEGLGATISVTLSGTDLTALIAGWADDGASSSGLLFRDDVANSVEQVFFVSKETGATNAGGGTAPRLIVDYTPIPEPSVALLGGLGLLGLLRRRRS